MMNKKKAHRGKKAHMGLMKDVMGAKKKAHMGLMKDVMGAKKKAHMGKDVMGAKKKAHMFMKAHRMMLQEGAVEALRGRSHHMNPSKYSRSLGHNVVTSLTTQTTTTLTVSTAAHNNDANDFMVVV